MANFIKNCFVVCMKKERGQRLAECNSRKVSLFFLGHNSSHSASCKENTKNHVSATSWRLFLLSLKLKVPRPSTQIHKYNNLHQWVWIERDCIKHIIKSIFKRTDVKPVGTTALSQEVARTTWNWLHGYSRQQGHVKNRKKGRTKLTCLHPWQFCSSKL